LIIRYSALYVWPTVASNSSVCQSNMENIISLTLSCLERWTIRELPAYMSTHLHERTHKVVLYDVVQDHAQNL
jgi:hypothetical protein